MKKLKEYIETGKITNTHGVGGEVRVEYWCDSADDFLRLTKLYLDENGGGELTVKKSRPADKFVIVQFNEFPTIDDAIKLKGKVVYRDRNSLKLPEGRLLLCDIIGLEAYDAQNGEHIGTVSDAIENPANLIYVIKKENGADVMIPAVDAFIERIDIEDGMFINVIPGLLD